MWAGSKKTSIDDHGLRRHAGRGGRSKEKARADEILSRQGPLDALTIDRCRNAFICQPKGFLAFGDNHAGQECVHPYRSEEHTSELQSLMRISYAVFCLQKKKEDSTKNNI